MFQHIVTCRLPNPNKPIFVFRCCKCKGAAMVVMYNALCLPTACSSAIGHAVTVYILLIIIR